MNKLHERLLEKSIEPKKSGTLVNDIFLQLDDILELIDFGYSKKQIAEELDIEPPLFYQALRQAIARASKLKKMQNSATSSNDDVAKKKSRTASAANETYPASTAVAADAGEPATAKKKSKIDLSIDSELAAQIAAQKARF